MIKEGITHIYNYINEKLKWKCLYCECTSCHKDIYLYK